MKHRAFALGLACLATLASQGAAAQGLRPSGAGKPALSRGLAPPPAAPAAVPTATGANTIRQADYIVAVVNSEPVTNHEVNVRLARIEAQLARQGGTPPPRDLLVREVLERSILEKAQLQAAREIGLKVDDLAVAQAEQGVARQNGVSLEEMHRRLAADGMSPQSFREDLRSQLLLQRLREREVEARVRVSEFDIDQYLQSQQSAATQGTTAIDLAQVLVPIPENASPADIAQLQMRAQSVADKARAGEDFAALARTYSAASESANGGAMGMRSVDRYPELFVTATQALPVGAIAGPLRSGAGFHILKVLDTSQAGAPTMVVQSHARHILLTTGPQLSETAAAQRLTDYRRRILAGQADFATLAAEYSKDGSAKQGGDLGWATPGRYVPEFEEAMNALKPGEISEPLVSRFGVHLIQLIERREVKLSQREQRDMARDTVREKKIEEAYTQWVKELRARAYVEYRDAPQ